MIAADYATGRGDRNLLTVPKATCGGVRSCAIWWSVNVGVEINAELQACVSANDVPVTGCGGPLVIEQYRV